METTIRGAISGIIGALASIIPGLLTRQVFKITAVNFLDYSAVLTVGHKATDIWHWMTAVVGHLIFGSVLGVIFALFLSRTTEESIIIKGCGFGAAVWLFTLALGSLYRLPHFTKITPDDCIWILIDALVYGLFLSLSYQWLSKRERTWR